MKLKRNKEIILATIAAQKTVKSSCETLVGNLSSSQCLDCLNISLALTKNGQITHGFHAEQLLRCKIFGPLKHADLPAFCTDYTTKAAMHESARAFDDKFDVSNTDFAHNLQMKPTSPTE